MIFIPIIIIVIVITIGILIFYFKQSRTEFQTRVRRKEMETFKVMGGANQVTSYHVTITDDDLQPVKLRVINPVLFEKIHEGDRGTAVVRGNILLSFKKRD